MAKVVYGLFTDAEHSAPAVKELLGHDGGRSSYSALVLDQKEVNENDLPESATEIGKNTLMGTLFGGGVGLIAGAGVAIGIDALQLTAVVGAMLGLLGGMLIGLLNGLMAGTRKPKAPLREIVESQLGSGAVLVVVNAENSKQESEIEKILASFGASHVDAC